MNKSSIVLLVTVALGFGVVVYLEEQLGNEIERVAQSTHAGSVELAAQSDRYREEIRQLREQVETYKKESEQLRSQLANAGARAATPLPDASDAKKGADATPAGGAKFMQGFAKMFTDPEMKKSMRVQQLVGIRMMYGDLAKELGLDAADGERVMEILADRQMDLSASAMANMDPNSPDKEASAKKLADTQKRYNEQLQAVLGEERFKRFQGYEGSMADRFMLQQFEGQFAAAGSPLEPDQKQKLLTFMREERSRTPNDSGLGAANPRKQMDALKSDEALEKFVTEQEALNQRVLARAKDVLNPDQAAALERVQQQQVEFIKMQMKMSRELLGIGK